ncbi:MAG: glycoside hydrolase family 3 N-terminal domain-containing protein [Arachidicoccus sp.]|nr:glycoside hydrolase family 3 N-terminal domain-containing protein [Arachidicoccus sp.]
MTKIRLSFCSLFLLLNICSIAQSAFQPNKSIYHKDWIDLNKNGKKDIYEDPSQPIDARVKNLLSQMTVDEKTCQLATLYGWKRVLKDSLPTQAWKDSIWKDGIANIDEEFNGFEEWGRRDKSTLATNIVHHIWGMNEVQRFFIEQTRLGVPADFTNEGIRGVEAYIATSFPTEMNMGMTWDKELVYKEGQIEGAEAKALGYSNVYAPIMDVARDQRWGRLEESFGEAPYLVAQLGYQMCIGMQEQGIASTLKHFAVYSANYAAREGLARTDPQIPEREMRDIELYPFEYVIEKAHPKGVMSSYNDYDGVPISGSKYWLTDVLRNKFGFKGYVVSDSDALEYLYNKHHVAADFKDAVYQALTAGMNVRTTFVPPNDMIIAARELVKENKLPVSVLDSRVADVLRVKFEVGLFDHPYVEDVKHSENIVNSAEHEAVSLRASRESIVLLKNADNILPFNKSINKVAVIGPNATNDSYAHTHYGPSGTKSVNVLEGIENKLGKDKVLYAKGCELVDKHWPESEILPVPPNATEQAQIDSAVAVAKQADVSIVVLGGNTKTAGESKSRTNLDLPGYQSNLIQAIQAIGKPVVVVLLGSQPMTINWIDKYIPGIIYAGYPGSNGGTAIADVLFGDYNPGGKLSMTFPKSVGQLPLHFPAKPNSQSDAGETARIKGLLYPFGFGLSYTTFKYSNLIVPKTVPLNNDVKISVDVTNTGKVAGDNVVQLYTRDSVSSVTTFEKNLAGFERVHLNPGETKTVNFTIANNDLKLWNREMQHVVEPGDFIAMIGNSSADIQIKSVFTMVE